MRKREGGGGAMNICLQNINMSTSESSVFPTTTGCAQISSFRRRKKSVLAVNLRYLLARREGAIKVAYIPKQGAVLLLSKHEKAVRQFQRDTPDTSHAEVARRKSRD